MNLSSEEPEPQKDESFELDPDKRDWEYDGTGKRVSKDSTEQDSASMVKQEITRDF